MSLGIFEQFLAEQQKTNTLLEEIARALGKTPTVTLEQTANAAAALATTTETQQTGDASAPELETDDEPSVELDNDDLPWDARINTANKSKTSKGVWKRKPGLTDEEYKSIRESLKNGLALAGEQKAAIEAGTKIPSPATKTAPPPPPAAGKDTKSPPPPPKPASNDLRQSAINAVDKLCGTFDQNSPSTLQAGVNIDAFNRYLTEYYGVATFAELTPDHFQQVESNCSQWQAELTLLNEQVKILLDAYASDVSIIEPHIVNVLGAPNTGEVDFSRIIDTRGQVQEYVATVMASA